MPGNVRLTGTETPSANNRNNQALSVLSKETDQSPSAMREVLEQS